MFPKVNTKEPSSDWAILFPFDYVGLSSVSGHREWMIKRGVHSKLSTEGWLNVVYEERG